MSRLPINAFLLTLFFCAAARAETPLYDQEPYDQITLDSASGDAVWRVKPLLDLPSRMVPPQLKRVGSIRVRKIEEPDKELEVQWRVIVKVELFEQLILNKANDLIAEEKFDEAYDYFAYLERNKSYAPVGEAVEGFLYEEAKNAHVKGQYDSALALLRELYRRNPKRAGLNRAMGMTTDKLVEDYAKREEFAAARVLLRNLAAAFPDHPVAKRWNQWLLAKATPLMDEARKAADAGQWDQAAELSDRVAALLPSLPGARELAFTIHQKASRVVVGVSSFAAGTTPARLDDWAARRICRLLYRTLTEFAGASSEGGKYLCPVGEISSAAVARRLQIKLKPGVRWAAGDAVLSSADVARRLLEMAKPGDPTYRVDWSDLLAALSVKDIYGLDVELRRVHVRPEAMLQIILTPPPSAKADAKLGDTPPGNGPFVVQSRSPQETVFTANRQYFASEAGQPKLLVERRYASVAQAVAALRRGDIQVVDRVNPWVLNSLRMEKHIRVQPYGLPLVHCLIPNVRRPLVGDPTFRRALAYGIQRQAILSQMLGTKENGDRIEIPGFAVASSPFPIGAGAEDPMGYASDESIEARPYEPRLAIALANVALKNMEEAKPGVAKKLKKMPTLVLAYPPDEIARAACASIQKQLKLLGIPLELRPFEGPLPAKIPDDVDLMYAELATWEPLVDARRLLGEDGLTGGCSPYMSLALRQLDEAVEWEQVRDCLRRIHHLTYENVSIVPLWQTMEHFAYHDSLRGISLGGVVLYQNIEQWRPPFRYPTDK